MGASEMSELDMQKVEQVYGQLFGKVEGALTCVLAQLGDKLGLYRALADAGSATSEELAGSTNLDPGIGSDVEDRTQGRDRHPHAPRSDGSPPLREDGQIRGGGSGTSSRHHRRQ